MHLPLTLIHALALAFAGASAFAHESKDSSRRMTLPGIDALPPAPLVAKTYGTDDSVARVRALLDNTRFRRLMTPPSADKVTPVLIVQDAAPFVRAFVAIERDVARRFALPIEHVRDEVDFLMNLSAPILPSADRAADVRAMLDGRRFAPLGPAFDERLYAAMTAVSSVLPAAYLTWVAERWRHAAETGRSILGVDVLRTLNQSARLNDWLAAPLPPAVTLEMSEPDAADAREAALDPIRRFYAELPASSPVETTICDLLLKNGKLPF